MQQNFDRYYYETIILAIVLTFQPFTVVGMVLPIACLTWFMVRSKSGFLLKKTVLTVIFLALVLLLYKFAGTFSDHPFILSNGIFSFLNYSSFIVILLLPSLKPSNVYNYAKYAELLLLVLLFQGAYGIFQKTMGMLLGVGHSNDIVEGTINPLSFLHGTLGFGNQYFAINVVFMLLFCFPYVYTEKKGLFSFFTGLFALLLASVGHVFLSLLFAMILVFLLIEGIYILFRPRIAFTFFIIPSVLILLLAFLDPSVYNGAIRQAGMFFRNETPKSKAINTVQDNLAQNFPTMYFIGLGPGQYSSRSGLLASGTYGSMPNLQLNLEMTHYFEEYVYPSWQETTTNDAYASSTMYRPFFSLLSVYTEFGGLFVLLVLFLLLFKTVHYKRIYRALKESLEKQASLLCFTSLVSIFFILFIAFHENYLETPQGIFLGLLLIKSSTCILTGSQKKEL